MYTVVKKFGGIITVAKKCGEMNTVQKKGGKIYTVKKCSDMYSYGGKEMNTVHG